MRRVNPDIRHVLIGKAYAAELLRSPPAEARAVYSRDIVRQPSEGECLGRAARLLRDSGVTLLPGRVHVETEDRAFTMAVPEAET